MKYRGLIELTKRVLLKISLGRRYSWKMFVSIYKGLIIKKKRFNEFLGSFKIKFLFLEPTTKMAVFAKI